MNISRDWGERERRCGGGGGGGGFGRGKRAGTVIIALDAVLQ